MSDEDLTGHVLGHYRIERRLGGGGMGDVWAAVQQPLGRRVALKVLRHELAADAELAARFKREAELAASLTHPNIAQVTDFGIDGGRAYLVMDLLQGESLASLLAREGALGETRARRIAVQVLAALAVAHARGVVHRDIKPENVFVQQVGETDIVKLLDFGIARIDERNATMTRAGAVLGTPAYMSPEQARGMKVDARSDVFSCGAMLYEMLSGRCPFVGENLHAVLFAVVEHTPTPLDRLEPATTPAVARAVERAMQKDPEARFADAREMMDALGTTGTHARADLVSPAAREAMESAPTVAADTASTPVLDGVRAGATPSRNPWRVGLAVGVIAVVGAGALALPRLLAGTDASAPAATEVRALVSIDAATLSVTATASSRDDAYVAAPPVVDAGEPAAHAEPVEPAATAGAPHQASPRPPATITVECGGWPQDLLVVRSSDRLTFGSAEGLSPVPPDTFGVVRESFNAQAAAALTRCYRGHGFYRAQNFEVDVDESGHVTRVDVSTFCPVDAEVASCARRVIGAVEVPTQAAFRIRLGATIPTR